MQPGFNLLLILDFDFLERCCIVLYCSLDWQSLHTACAKETVKARHSVHHIPSIFDAYKPFISNMYKNESNGGADHSLEIGPPWQSTMTSGSIETHAVLISSTALTASSKVISSSAPMLPPVVSPRCATTTSAPARVMR